MVFSSLLFLFGFLPIALLAYLAAPHRFRNHVALAASCLFYAWGAPRFIFVLLASCTLDYVISRQIVRPGTAPARRRTLLAMALTYNLAVLGYFKYANFFVGQFNALLAWGGFDGAAWIDVALPIGISFFTFHKISYLVDIYRGTAAAAPTLGTYFLYILLFPQLIAGPIIRYHDIADQLRRRTVGPERFFAGVWRFCKGLAKKVLIANVLAEVADRAFDMKPAALSGAHAWLGILCYSFQIYFDFSGYSDMAIGLGRMMGFEFLENFNRPYISRNFTEFWRRWHISLSNFMREYLYVPLGGNRAGRLRTYLNLWIVFVLSGLWHGAAWNFIVWGAFHGLFLSLDKLVAERTRRAPPAWLSIPATFLLVSCGWVFFRADTLTHAARYLDHMARPWTFGACSVASLQGFMPPQAIVALIVAAAVSFAPAVTWRRAAAPGVSVHAGVPMVALQGAAALLLLFLSACALTAGNFNPFIYFRF